ncbi:magnesium-translocating P-type ATPase [Megasphaera paucivorans]|uniref:Magnesium-transporting ATPase, P-type 1 n=1 Tax=Megasphaera paucivorans TaxID=349095 RepID=A0A1G9WCI5_9FIRM|nr:magnesium-translocating P-type ATPase [Megasphaera paucivorans]SDM82284.1 Mg2+-importing ATPase [Megasphaera paucivorans]
MKKTLTASALTAKQVLESRQRFGTNAVTHGKKIPLSKRIVNAFINPFTIVLFILAVVSAFTDIIMAEPGEANPTTVGIITTMVLISGILRFVQETRSGNAASKLSDMIQTTACIERQESGKQEIPISEIVVDDIVYISAGDMIPADMQIITAKDLFISQSALTGESEPLEKTGVYAGSEEISPENKNLVFMGSTVVSGSGIAIVQTVGNATMLGQIAKHLNKKPVATTFDKGVNSVSWVLIRFMLIMVPVVLFINGFTKGDWMNAALFAISVAVGLTPEMLPMIVTTCLAKGAVAMSQEQVIIKNLNAIQNLGSMDILCTDKTGTLTQDKVVLECHLDITGNEDTRVLRHAFLNSYYQTGLKNLMDIAIIDRTKELVKTDGSHAVIEDKYNKVDEIPFDFERRRMSVVVADTTGKTQLITKGAIEEMLRISSYVEYQNQVMELTEPMKQLVLNHVDKLNSKGMRVLGVAQKTNPSPVDSFSTADEADMVLIGYLAFLDPPKETTAAAIKALHDSGVTVKILTGDNEKVTQCICQQVGLTIEGILLGSELAGMDDAMLCQKAEKTTIFAKLSPTEKERVVTALRKNGHSVGYMGDGINDAVAMKAADVGISVDTAVDIAKESADVILLEKNLLVLEKGILEGRKTYANMIKYIKMTASSNFGNMFSVLIASAFLPFLPMSAIHLILLNMIYDISCTAIPWDNVDIDYLNMPRKWDALSISRFMIDLGPISSIFDIATYILMYFIVCPAICGGSYYSLGENQQLLFISLFQTGWFIESMWSQTLVIHMLRTPKIPFFQSHASWQVTLLTFMGIAILTLIPFTTLGNAIGLHSLPFSYFILLSIIIAGYMILVTFRKNLYVKKYGELL